MRYERKFRITDMTLPVLRQVIELHPASFRTLYPDRQVNSIYLDTEEFQTWNQNVMGHNERKKYRIRWYGSGSVEITAPQFEVKQKHNELGWKEVFQLSDFSLDNLNPALSEIRTKYPELSLLEPRLINSYTRSYFGSFDRKFRLTLDRDMNFYRADATALDWVNGLIDPGMVLEVKYEEAYDSFVNEITQHLPFRQSKHSKYVQGVLLIEN